MPPKPHIVIVGGGFGGVRTARRLAHQPGFDITLISDRDSFAYYPQLYHAATGGARSESSLPLASLLEGTGVKLVQDKLVTLHPDSGTLTLASGTEVHYDKLVLALGSVTNYFGIKGLPEFAYNIKTIEGAEAFKAHLHKELVDNHKPELHYVVVGAEPTGVELAAALGQYLQRIIALHDIKRPRYQIDLVEAAPRILPRSSDKEAAKVLARLEKLGVRITTGAVVEGETHEQLQLAGRTLTTQTVVWTAGVANNPFFRDNPTFQYNKPGRVVVNDHMEALPGVYVIGDNAATQYGGLAETAVNDANFVARDIFLALTDRPRPAYVQPHPASVIPVGTRWASAQYKGLQFYGYLGWILRRLGDLVAYRDIESTSSAISVWLKEGRSEHSCPLCDHAAS